MSRLLLLPFLFFACKGPQGDPGPAGAPGAQGPSGPTGTATLPRGEFIGAVELRNEFGGIEPDASGVTIAIEPTTLTATTNTEGVFRFPAVEAGTYRISASKSGYGTMLQHGVTLLGTPTPNYSYIYLSRISTTAVSQLAAAISGPNLSLTAQTSPVAPSTTGRSRTVRIFFGRDPDVSSAKYTSSLQYPADPTGKVNYTESIQYLKDQFGFKTGERVYVVMHGAPGLDISYFSPITRRFVYPSLNPTPSNVASVVLP